MRITTWNIWNAETEFVERVQTAGDVLAGLQCDVVLLQENRAWKDGSTARMIAETTGHIVSEGCFTDAGGFLSGLAVLSRSAPVGLWEVPLSTRGDGAMLVVGLETEYGPTYVGSVQLTRDPASEYVRQTETVTIERHAREMNARRSIVGGSFHTVSDADSVRYLTGRTSHDGSSAFWIDAWEAVGEGAGYTLANHNSFLRDDREAGGMDRVDLHPPRREDLLLVRGCLYGEAGAPFNASLIGTGSQVCSDHYGVAVEFL